MTADKTTELFRSATESAMHLEMRDLYTPDDPDWLAWKGGERFDPAERWPDWYNLMVETTGRGVQVRRARIISEPITDYIRFEYDVTADHNVKAGELVRWLPRSQSAGLLVPPMDHWVIDRRIVIWNVFAGDGTWTDTVYQEDEEIARLCADAFDAVWERATPHEHYRPA